MKDISICIASRGNPLGLWLTINSIEFELKQAKLDFEFCIVTNGEDKLHADTRQTLAMLKNNTKYLGYHEHFKEPLTPQMGRQKAIENSQGKYIFCADNHIVVCPNFFARLLHDWEKTNADVLHSCTQYYIDDVICYGYKLQPYVDFWGTSETLVVNEYKPFKIAAAGHGGVGFKRSSFDKFGGYFLSSSFVGYAGEELTYDIGTWMQGGTVYISPQCVHRHWAATTRGYGRHHTEDFYKNLFSCAFIMTDEKADNYVYKMLDHFRHCSKPFLKKPMFNILMEAQERSKPFTSWLRERRQRTFEEQLQWFHDNEVAYK